MIADAELDRLIALSERATEGPWTVDGHKDYVYCQDSIGSAVACVAFANISRREDETIANRDLIAAAREAVPTLARELREAREALRRWQSYGRLPHRPTARRRCGGGVYP